MASISLLFNCLIICGEDSYRRFSDEPVRDDGKLCDALIAWIGSKLDLDVLEIGSRMEKLTFFEVNAAIML